MSRRKKKNGSVILVTIIGIQTRMLAMAMGYVMNVGVGLQKVANVTLVIVLSVTDGR